MRYKAIPELDYQKKVQLLFPEIIDKKAIRQITFQVTEDCCLACTYCYQINKSKNKMSFETAKEFLDNLFEQKYPEINKENTLGFVLDFIGGEPLLEIELIQQIIEYFLLLCVKYNSSWAYYSCASICSNGMLYFNEKVQDFFKKYHQFVGFSISIDGNKQLHDACRIDLNGNGSYDKAINAVRHYRKTYNHYPSVKMTFSPDNITYTSDALINLIIEDYKHIHANCIFEEGWTYEHASVFYYELKKVADYIIDNEFYKIIELSLFNENSYQPDPYIGLKNWCGGLSNNMIAIDYKGDIYHCIRFMNSSLDNSQPPFIVGTIKNGFGSTKEQKQRIQFCESVNAQSQSDERCLKCPIAAGCAWCSGYGYQKYGTLNHRTTFHCCMYQAQCLANVYYWNKLYKKLGINKTFKNNLYKEDALKIIDNKELQFLISLENKEI